MTGLTDKSPADHPEDEKLLYATMRHNRDVKLAITALKNLFDPIRLGCVLLRKHGNPVNEDKLGALEAAPARWEEVIRLQYDERERILPLQNVEMLKIRKKIDNFSGEVSDFRSQFLKECPFSAAGFVDVPMDEATQGKVKDAPNAAEQRKIVAAFEAQG